MMLSRVPKKKNICATETEPRTHGELLFPLHQLRQLPTSVRDLRRGRLRVHRHDGSVRNQREEARALRKEGRVGGYNGDVTARWRNGHEVTLSPPRFIVFEL